MKKSIIFLLSLLSMSSCSKDEFMTQSSILNTYSDDMISGIKKFNSKKELSIYIQNNENYINTKSDNDPNFTSAESISNKNQEIQFLVPDKKIRNVLNDKLEVIASDTIYKVTKNGTFYTHIKNLDSFEKEINNLSQFKNITLKLKEHNGVYLYDTHDIWQNNKNNPINNPHYFDDPDDDLYNKEQTNSQVIKTKTDSGHREITDADFDSFESMGIVKPSIIGKALEFVCNTTTYNKFRFKSNGNRKLYVSFYNKDFAFFRSSGFDIKVMKKLWYGGWGRMVNWECGVYAGFSDIQIAHTVKIDKTDQLSAFIGSIRKQREEYSNKIRFGEEYYRINQNEAVLYHNYPYQNDNGTLPFSIPLVVDAIGEKKTYSETVKLLKKGLEFIKKEYNKKQPVSQYTAFDSKDNRTFYTLYSNLLYFNGGGYRVRDEILKESKSVVIGFKVNGGSCNIKGVNIGDDDIIESKIVRANGFIYTEDGDDFIGVKISIDEK